MRSLPYGVRGSPKLCKIYVGLNNLCDRREFFKICFMFKLLNNICDAPSILHTLKFNVPQYAVRKVPLFYIETYGQYYALYSPLNSILLACNLVSANVDFFNDTFNNFKATLRRILYN